MKWRGGTAHVTFRSARVGPQRSMARTLSCRFAPLEAGEGLLLDLFGKRAHAAEESEVGVRLPRCYESHLEIA